MQSAGNLLMFRMNVLHPSSRKKSRPSKQNQSFVISIENSCAMLATDRYQALKGTNKVNLTCITNLIARKSIFTEKINLYKYYVGYSPYSHVYLEYRAFQKMDQLPKCSIF